MAKPYSKRRIGAGAGLGAALLVALVIALPGEQKALPPAPQKTNAQPESTHDPKGATASLPADTLKALVLEQDTTATIPEDFFAHLPASLASAGQPAPLTVDEAGVLIADIRLRRLFDYYLSAIGEEPLEHIVARIRHALRQQLTETDFHRALQLLEGYLQLRNEVGNLVENYNLQHVAHSPADLGQLLQAKKAIKELREDYLPENVVEAFFAEEDAYDNYMLARADILRDNTRNADEKRIAIALLEQQHESTLPVARRRSETVANLKRSETLLRERGATQDELFALRAERVGQDAAQRLAQLDEQRQLWNKRLTQYQNELRIIEADTEYPESERTRLINELRNRHFTQTEAKRVDALDRIKAAR